VIKLDFELSYKNSKTYHLCQTFSLEIKIEVIAEYPPRIGVYPIKLYGSVVPKGKLKPAAGK
jgi:hypothetical protein